MTAQQPNSIAQEITGAGLTIHTVAGESVILRGECLSAYDKDLVVKDQYQDFYAYVTEGKATGGPAGGILLFARGKRHDQHVATYAHKVRQKGYKITKHAEVEISELKKVYAAAREEGAKKGLKVEGEASAPEMRGQLVEWIGRAAAAKASDIHISADDYGAAVQMRIDGVMVHITELPIDYAKQMMAAAAAMGTASDTTYNPYDFQNASIVDADGKIGLPKAVQSIRLQWNPLMLAGRYLVMRLHYSSAHSKLDLESLGFDASQLEQIRMMRQKSNGIVVISGPTGSGKSTTLKNALSSLLAESKRTKNVVSVEDPPEFYIDGIKQMQVMNAKTGEERKAKFIAAIMAALRDDPDVIMIGEVRDKESGSLAYDAANTGHGVWTSLHANNAIAIINRLLDLGLESYKVTDHETIIGLLGQRLVRRLCQHCKIPAEQGVLEGTIEKDALTRARHVLQQLGIGDTKLYARNPNTKKKRESDKWACDHCRDKGFAGRTVCAEVITPDETFMQFCRDQKKTDARNHWVEKLNGFTMMAHGIAKMAAGIISPDDVERSINPIAYDNSMKSVKDIMARIPAPAKAEPVKPTASAGTSNGRR